MHSARERAAALRPGPDALLAPVVLALLTAALFAGEAFATAAAALIAAGAVAALALLGRLPLRRGAGALVGALVALAAWNGLSAWWSVAPDASWRELNRGLAYAAFAVLGAALGSLPRRPLRAAAVVVGLPLAAAVFWALAGKAIPALFPDGGRAARLRDPIGYWNALALVADALLVLGLWTAARPARRRGPVVVGTVLAYAAVVAVLLTASRAGLAAGVVAVGAWLALDGRRVERALLALAAAVPGGIVAAWTFTRPALVEDGQELADRAADGRLFALVFVVGAVAAGAAGVAAARAEPSARGRRLLGRGLAAGVAVLLLAGAVGIAATGDPFASGRSVAQGPGRLADAGLNNRRQFWVEAVRVARLEPLTGTGAGTFELARRRVRDDATSGVEPHNVPLQFLAGTGPVGLALFLAVVAAAFAAAVGALRRTSGEERRAAAALAVVPLAYLVHALVDYDWNFLAVTAPTLVAVGALATAARAPLVTGWRAAAAVAAGGVAAAALVSTSLPWLAERSLQQVAIELERGEVGAARDAAERARALDPLSIAPLHALAGVHARRDDVEKAREAYAAAVRLQPENPETWYELGLYEYELDYLCQAYRHLNEAYTLDTKSTRWVPGGPLDVAREAVDAGRCG
ncbi:MAG TPA: O-antigen ligase family protein [Gaiellaceae bacterium]|nr:O-antigen ligase family protein [Gaiellaceae bacterium]